MDVSLNQVTVLAGGHVVLDEVTVAVRPGQHIAIVGRSGSGKSSLLAVLLGVLRPASGAVVVDGVELSDDLLGLWRPHVAWVDPDVRVWNTPLVDNVCFGSAGQDPWPAMGLAGLGDVGQSVGGESLGESGGRLSGGQRQRVRLARALVRSDPALVVLDEAFRGLERAERERLLVAVRQQWSAATLLAVTHDTASSLGFDRVLVVDDGRVVADGAPSALAQQAGPYRDLLCADAEVNAMWSGWRHAHLSGGALVGRRIP